jgi:hypothetical protein
MPAAKPTTVVLDGPINSDSGAMPSGSIAINIEEKVILVGPPVVLADLTAHIASAITSHLAGMERQ